MKKACAHLAALLLLAACIVNPLLLISSILLAILLHLTYFCRTEFLKSMVKRSKIKHFARFHTVTRFAFLFGKKCFMVEGKKIDLKKLYFK
jgi:hypothetical protein